MSGVTIEAGDGTRLYVEDRGSGPPIVFLAAWTFDSEFWGEAIAAMSALGHRCVAPDRRGHGRSAVAAGGYDTETLVADLAAIFERLDLRGATIVAHSMGAMEAVHYAAQDVAGRVARLLLVATSTPIVIRTDDNPDGVPDEAIVAQCEILATDFAGWLAANGPPFVKPETSNATLAWFRAMALTTSVPVAIACWNTFARTDSRAAARAVRRPTLVIHGDKDASAPLELTGKPTARLIPGAELRVYEGAPHGLPITHAERFIADLAAFVGR